MIPRRPGLLLALLVACTEQGGETAGPAKDAGADTAADTDTVPDPAPDADGDGYRADTDCDDTNEAVHPGATERCDGLDDDCDGLVDDEDPDLSDAATWYADADADGHGDSTVAATACEQPAGAVADDGDCDDGDSGVNPDVAEVCDDGVDNDCDGAAETCRLSGTLSLSAADAEVVGETAGGYAGHCVSGAGDVNGDGHDDLLIGAFQATVDGTSAGAAYVVLGPVTGEVSLADASARLIGEAENDLAAYSVSRAGDVDGDGNDDLLVGAFRNGTGGPASGGAYVVFGPPSGDVDLGSADVKLVGDNLEAAGYSVSSAGDQNRDGLADLLVGAPGNNTGGESGGAAYVVLGPLTGTTHLAAAEGFLVAEATGDNAGSSVSQAGDVDGDGIDDVLVGAYRQDGAATDAGAAYLVLGPIRGEVDLADAEAKLTGTDAENYAATVVAGAGDVDGDGHDDVLVGAYRNDGGGLDAGAAYLVLGAVSGTVPLAAADARLLGENGGDHAGTSVAGAGDVDGDGFGDVAVSAPHESGAGTQAGATYLLYGPLGGTMSLSAADAKLLGENAEDFSGWSIAGAGDTDADGHSDLLIGAYGADQGGDYAGAAYLVLGSGM